MRSSRDHDLDELTDLAVAAQDGDRAALSVLSREMQQPVYRLALRFCGHPMDAEDVALMVMLRLLTTLETYDPRSRFTTWVYGSAVRQLLRTDPRPTERAVPDQPSTSGTLLWLPRERRVAYLLVDLLGFTMAEGSEICAADRGEFQERLTTARSELRRRRAERSASTLAETDPNVAVPESVWSRLVATMPTHLGAD